MELEAKKDVVKNTIFRMIVVLLSTIALGFAFFRFGIFDMKMVASQFLTSGLTAAIFYSALHTPRPRDGYVALLVWYLILTFLVGNYNSWLPVLYFGYVAGIGAAVYVYEYFVRKEIVRGMIQRVAAAGVMVAIANAVIVVFLGLWSVKMVLASPGFFASTVFRNLQFGTLIGIAFGVGVELAEYLIRRTAPVSTTPS